MSLAEGARADRDVLEAPSVDGFHDLADNLVTVTEMMMEADDHAVMGIALVEDFVDGRNQLAAAVVHDDFHVRAVLFENSPVIMEAALERLFAGLI